jgi:hypothetical protein
MMLKQVLAAGIPAMVTATVVAQERVVLTGPTCESCRITAQQTHSIGLPPDGLPGWPTAITHDSRGRYYLTIPEVEAAPMVYDDGGRFLTRLGREGRGPGEYRYANYIVTAEADTLLVLDPSNSRLSVIGPDHTFVRSVAIPVSAQRLVRLPGGDFVLNASIRDRERVGLPLHRFSAQGELLASFGAVNPTVLPGDAFADLRRIALSQTGDLWVAVQIGRYAFELWRPDGRRLREFTRSVSWFPDYGSAWDQTPGRAPYPRNRGIWEDTEGRVWIVSLVAAPNWEDGIGEVRRLEGKQIYTIADDQKAFDTIVEVVDPDLGQVLASSRFDEAFSLVVEPGVIAVIQENVDLTFRADLWTLDFER